MDKVYYVIKIDGSTARLCGDPPLTLCHELELVCSYSVLGAQYIRQHRKWDGVVHLFDTVALRFPVGLVSNIKSVIELHHKARGEEVEFVVIDKRPDPEVLPSTIIPDFDAGFELWSHQKRAIEIAFRDGSGLIQLPTGSGKTAVIAAVIAGYKVRSVIFVHTRDLLYQMKEKLVQCMPGLVVGQIGDGVCEPGVVTVCMVQTIAAVTEDIKHPKDIDISKIDDVEDLEDKLRDYDADNYDYFMERITIILKVIQGAGLIIYDESHHVPARTHVRTAQLARNAVYRFGFSATQYRNDGAELAIYGALGRSIMILDASDLTPQILVPPVITFMEVPQVKFAKTDTYQTVYSQYIVNSKVRNSMILAKASLLVSEGHKVIILLNRIAHGDILKAMFDRARINAEFIKGELDSSIRNDILRRMRDGEVDVLIGTSLADEGLDIPIADALMIVGAGKSQVKTLQRVGRVLRKYPGKEQAIVIDMWDRCRFLSQHSKKRRDLYRMEKKWKLMFGEGLK